MRRVQVCQRAAVKIQAVSNPWSGATALPSIRDVSLILPEECESRLTPLSLRSGSFRFAESDSKSELGRLGKFPEVSAQFR